MNTISTKILRCKFLRQKGLRKIPGISAAYNKLFQLSWNQGNVIDIQGSKMYVDVCEKSPSMRNTFQAYALNRIHEKETTELFKNIVKPGDVVVDLGANIGYFTLLAANIVGEKGKVYAFEPEPKNYGYLQKNIELNNYTNVVATRKAISDRIGKTKLHICSYDTGHHTINQFDGIKDYAPSFAKAKDVAIDIDIMPLDVFFENKNKTVNVIKMDVEGAEFLALSGMDKIIRTNKNLKMFVEFFPFLIKKMGNSPEEFIQKLLSYGFSIRVIKEDYQAGHRSTSVNSAKELMALCEHEKDHLNLFLEREN